MTGGLIQLMALGNEDLYLTSDPQITFFKMVYKRHTNFSVESVPQNFNSKPDFGKKITCTLGKNADLVSQIYLVVTLPQINYFQESIDLPNLNKCAWTKNIGWNIIKSVEIEIGGYIIDKHYGDWLYVWSELTSNNNTDRGQDIMIGNVPTLTNLTNSKDSYILTIPLYFWFCKNNGLALPIIALEFSDVKINVEFAALNDLLILSPTNYIDIDNNFVQFKQGDILYQQINTTTNYIIFQSFAIISNTQNRLYYTKISSPPIVSNSSTNTNGINYKIYSLDGTFNVNITNGVNEMIHINKQTNFAWTNSLSIVNASLLVDFIYLDTNERIKFIRSNHEYLIDTLLFDNDKTITTNSSKIKLSYCHPCKEIIFRAQMDSLVANNLLQTNNFMLDYFQTTNIINTVQIIMNGIDRISQRSSDYFHLIQPFQNHSNMPLPGLFCYSFSLFPEDHQPSGTCNLSKIDDFQLVINTNKTINYLNTAKIRIYALCVNILRIFDGQGGLAFSN
jgi:hypothetical protein